MARSEAGDRIAERSALQRGDDQMEVPRAWREEPPAAVGDRDVMLIMTRLSRLARMVHEKQQSQLRSVSMSYSDYAALHALAVAEAPGRLSPTQLNETLGLTSGGITKAIDRLEKAGLVRRNPDPSDGRGVLVSLTARGQRRAHRIFEGGLEHYAGLLSGFAPADRRRIARSLRELIDALEPLGG